MFPRIGVFLLIAVFLMCLGRSSALELSSLSCYGVNSQMTAPQLRAILNEQGFQCHEARLPGGGDSRQLVFTRGDTQLLVLTYGPQVLEIFTPEVAIRGHHLWLGMERRQLIAQLGLPNAVERADEVELLYYRSASGEFGVQMRQGKVDLFRLSPAQSPALMTLPGVHESTDTVPRSAVGMCILGLALLALSKTLHLARARFSHA
ncbi:MAG: hypothetical protein KF760_31690 [Candidatus Eremiobacteraeota bacterium]|nr:hypothetical protein [Candidatus Eremiobacteraeota bacterium]MCW5870019.1 hypothetical protein [Candidatus Eremiobacteraeota bacterium]